MSTAAEAPTARERLDEEWLRDKYWADDLTQTEIAALAGVHQSDVSRAMAEYGVPTRGHSPDSEPEGYRSEAWLRDRYWGERMSTREMADEAGVAHNTIIQWMQRHGVEARPRSEAAGRPQIPDAEIRQDVERAAAGLGRRPSAEEYDRRGRFSSQTVSARWGEGSWPRAMDELGV